MKKNQIKRGAAGIVLIILLSIILPAGQVFAEESVPDDEYIDIIVRYEDTVPDEDSLDSSYKNVQTMDILPIRTMSVPVSAIKELSLEASVRRITYDQEVAPSQSTYELTSDDWNQDMIGTFNAWEEGYTGRKVNVAVLDTGFYEHPEISYAGGHSIFDDEYELGPDEWTNDHSGHGTHVAGILGAQQGTRAQGIAPGIDLYGVKVYHKENGDRTRIGNLLSGLNWAIQNGSDIIVVSSGYPEHNQEIYDMIQLAYEQGILIIAASGNMTDENLSIDYPAAHEEVIAVSGVNNRQVRVSDSMVANENELAAPGQNILSLSTDGTHATMSGTSQAAPHVAGIAALLMEKYPSDSPAAIRQRMQDKALDLGDPGRDVLYGHGLVQFGEAAAEEPLPEEEPDEGTDEEPEEDPSASPEEDTDVPDETPEDDESEEAVDGETDDEQLDTEEENESAETDDLTSEDPEDPEDSEDSEEATEEDADPDDTDPQESDEPLEEEDDEEDVTEDPEELAQQKAVWIRPSETNGLATVAEEDIESVADNGVLAISFDESLNHIDRISLSRDQVRALKEKNVTLLVARVDLEWVIPSSNLSEGNAFITFRDSDQELDFRDITKGKLLSFGIEQDGEQISTFPSPMTYRFFTPEVEYNQDALYHWNESTKTWELIGDAYTKGGVVGVISETPTLAVFNPEELDAAIAAAEAEADVSLEEEVEASKPEQPVTEVEGDEENEDSEEDSSGMPIVLSSVVVVLLSVTGGFYILGGKSKK